MSRRQLLYLLYTSSARPPSSFPYFTSTPPTPPPFLFYKGYSHERSTRNHAVGETIDHERAPSTLEEFKRIEEEKANQDADRQNVEKVKAGAMEAATGDDSVKESFKKARAR
ncbi:hypothetical protein R6Q59_009630 [Mikania micrantha]|uniref:Uncharacterized protein n=1 Tax=Mikania micrantha TaxID=192012 RepID=A0A5N6N8Q9_9ASTR|nr:hypothetical protein E3N88_26249 [Mikania micrantha]